jgi:PEP-CTERM motif
MMRSVRILAVTALVLLSAPAFAVSFQVTGWDLGETVNVTFSGQARSFATAQFQENVDGVVGTSFCADLSQYIGKATYSSFVAYDPAAAETQSFAVGPPQRQFQFAATIVDQWGNSLDWLQQTLGVTHVQAITGVQAAVWEAVYGNAFSATSGSMSAGAFRVFGYVLGFNGYTGYGQTQLYYSAANQDQLFTPPVPEPSAMIVFGAGALIVGQALLRRRNRA